MVWPVFFILGYTLVGIHVGAAGLLNLGGMSPNLVVAGVVLLCMWAPRDAAMLGSLLLGAMQDMVTEQPLGLWAFTYGLAAVVLTTLQPALQRGHLFTQVVFAVVCAGLSVLVLAVSGWLNPPGAELVEAGTVHRAVRLPVGKLLWQACLTVVAVPVLIWFFRPFHRLLGLPVVRRRRYD
jgi:cell shape-determining protein MreD